MPSAGLALYTHKDPNAGVLTYAICPIECVAWSTVTPVAAIQIHTFSQSLADVRILHALVNVLAGLAIATVAMVTGAQKAACSVVAGAIVAAHGRCSLALVDIWTT